jgi:N-glycosidase YbiA
MSKTERQVTINRFEGVYSFLSNFYPCPITFDGDKYDSVEHAYQAAKTTDAEERIKFQSYRMTPAGEAKRLGRLVTLRKDWEQVKNPVMLDLLRKKFLGTKFTYLLGDTGSEELVEGNWWGDTYWGVCNGVGENYLGKLLMQVRSEIIPERGKL